MTEHPKEDDIVKADPKHQRLALLLLALGASLGVWSLLNLEQKLSAARAVSFKSVSTAAHGTLEVAVGYFQGMGAITALFGLYLVVLAVRIWISDRFPPPGAWVVRDTKIQRAWRARSRSLVAGIVGLALLSAGLVMPAWAEQQLVHLLSGALQTPDTPPESYLPHIE